MNEFTQAVENLTGMKATILQLQGHMDEVNQKIMTITYRISECELMEFDIVHVSENLKGLTEEQALNLTNRLTAIRKERRDLKQALSIHLELKKVVEKLRPSINEGVQELSHMDGEKSPHESAYRFRTQEIFELASSLDLDDKEGLFRFVPPSSKKDEAPVEASPVPVAKVSKPKGVELKVSRIGKSFKLIEGSNVITSSNKFNDILEMIVTRDPDSVIFTNGTIEMFNSFKKQFRNGKGVRHGMDELAFEILCAKVFKG